MVRLTSLLAVGAFAVAPRLYSQSTSLSPDAERPAWLDRWSPLAPVDLARRLPTPGFAPTSFLGPSPRIGGFWTAGNPGALASELSDTRSDFGLAYGKERGGYRRPLDPVERGLTQASASGWKPMTSRFALLGRVVFDQERFDPGSRADLVEAYPSSPFVTIDTSASATRRTRARLEGAGGWQSGRLGVGIALGYQTRSHETIQSGFVRRTRQTLPGAAAGVTWAVGGVRLGAWGRWSNRAETIRLLERTAQGKVIQLQGLKEVPVLDIQNAYYRRADEDVGAVGLSASGRWGRLGWVGYGQRTRLSERLTRQEADDPQSDRWDADGWIAGAALERSLGARRTVSVDLRYQSLAGAADAVLDSAAVIFEAAERSLSASAEFRAPPDRGRWGLAIKARVGNERRIRNDLAITFGSRVSATTLAAGAEVARAISPAVMVTVGVAAANYSANSALPAPAVLGTTYRTWHLPELDLASRQARPVSGAIGGQWRVSPRSVIQLSVRLDRVGPVGSTRPTPFGPEGSRRVVSVQTGVTIN